MSEDKTQTENGYDQYLDEKYGFKREKFDCYIDKLNEYRKEEFLEDDLIDKDLAWKIRRSLESDFYEAFGRSLQVYDGRGTKIIVILVSLVTIFSAINGIWFSFNANSYLVTLAFAFFIRHMYRLCDYYQYVINPKNFVKDGLWPVRCDDDSYLWGFLKSAIHFEGSFFIALMTLGIVFIRITSQPLLAPTRVQFLSFIALCFLIPYNLLLYIPMVRSLRYELSKYRAQELLPYLLDFAELNIAVPFWTCFIVFAATVTTLQPACPWIIFPFLPIVLYFKKKLDFQFLLKNVLLNYQKCQKG